MKATDRITRLRDQVTEQKQFMQSCGGTLTGYIAKHGDPGIAPQDDNGNAKTFACPADLAQTCGLRPVPDADGCYFAPMFGSGGSAIYQADYNRLRQLEQELEQYESQYGHAVPKTEGTVRQYIDRRRLDTAKRIDASRKWQELHFSTDEQRIMVGNKQGRALAVLALTEHIRDYLAEHDAMALRQAQAALSAGHSYAEYME